jgi:hypothetical protein
VEHLDLVGRRKLFGRPQLREVGNRHQDEGAADLGADDLGFDLVKGSGFRV